VAPCEEVVVAVGVLLGEEVVSAPEAVEVAGVVAFLQEAEAVGSPQEVVVEVRAGEEDLEEVVVKIWAAHWQLAFGFLYTRSQEFGMTFIKFIRCTVQRPHSCPLS
jgi:hypothetical protein